MKPPRPIRTTLPAALLATVALGACGAPPPRARPAAPPANVAAAVAATSSVAATSAVSAVNVAPVQTDRVHIKNFDFGPQAVEVPVGATVTWVNDDAEAHTVDFRQNGGDVASGVLETGQSYSHTFTGAGDFQYICGIHTHMHGRVRVVAR